MRVGRRKFLGAAAVGAGAVAIGCGNDAAGTTAAQPAAGARETPSLHPAIAALKPMTAGVVPISDDERTARIAKAQKLMTRPEDRRDLHGGHDELLLLRRHALGPERAHVRRRHPREGRRSPTCARASKRDRARELIKPAFGDEVRVWQEDESPYKVIAGIVKDRGVQYHRIGIEERVRFFIADGVRKDGAGRARSPTRRRSPRAAA